MKLEAQDQNLFLDLVAQMDKVFRHSTDVSHKSKRRYYEAMQRFCVYLADDCHLRDLSGISKEHLIGYISKQRARGYSERTIKSDLSAIRYCHDRLPYAGVWLPDNKALGL